MNLPNPDERRVREDTPAKIEAARQSGDKDAKPPVAATAAETQADGG